MKLRWNLVLFVFALFVGASACNKSDGGSAQSNEADHAAVPDARKNEAAATAPRSTPEPVAKPSPRRIVGHVSSTPDGKPVVDAIIRVSSLGHSKGKSPSWECRSDSAGAYVLDDAPVGNWMLTCRAQMRITAQNNVFVPAVGGDVVHDFELDADPHVTMIVRLHARGGASFMDGLMGDDIPLVALLHPVIVDQCPTRDVDLPAGTKVTAFKGAIKDLSNSDEWYEVTLQSPQPGCCCLMIGDRVLDTAAFAAAATQVTLETTIADVHAAMGTVRLKIVDAVTKSALVGARATLRPASGPALVVDTYSEGTVEFAHVLPGDALLELEAPKHAHAKQKIKVRAGEENDLGTLSLPASIAISGAIDMPTGADAKLIPIAEAFAYLVDDNGGTYVTSIRAGADGKFVFEKLDPGEYLIGWQPRHPAPDVGPVQKGAIPGWMYVDARYSDVSNVHIGVTAAMWDAEATRKGGAH